MLPKASIDAWMMKNSAIAASPASAEQPAIADAKRTRPPWRLTLNRRLIGNSQDPAPERCRKRSARRRPRQPYRPLTGSSSCPAFPSCAATFLSSLATSCVEFLGGQECRTEAQGLAGFREFRRGNRFLDGVLQLGDDIGGRALGSGNAAPELKLRRRSPAPLRWARPGTPGRARRRAPRGCAACPP